MGGTQLFATAESSQTCTVPKVETPFVRFGDRRNYVMAPSGSFESSVLCVDFDYPTFRLLSKALSKGELKIEVTYPDARAGA